MAGKAFKTRTGLSIYMTRTVWDALDKAAEEKGMLRSRYIDRLVAAVLRDNLPLDPRPEGVEQYQELLRLTATKRRTGWISLQLKTWEAFDEAHKKKHPEMRRNKLLENIFLSQLIKPTNERVKFDNLQIYVEEAKDRS